MAIDLDARLMEIVVCPAPDHGSLRVGYHDQLDISTLSCSSCGRTFPIKDGIPVLLLDEVLNSGAVEQDIAESRSARV